MLIIKTIEQITQQFKSAVVTIGNFDGVHIGHQALLLETISKAREIKGTSVAVTFEPHPTQITNQNLKPKLITSYRQKNKLIAALGIDTLLCIPFTKKFASISAIDFIKKLLIERIGMKIVVIGKGYSFGKNRVGDEKILKEYANKLNFQVIVKQWVKSPKIANNRISSTTVRKMVVEGKVENARKMLGRNYCMQGKVVHGMGRGKGLLGIPTINVNPENDLYPKSGTYAVTIKHKNKIHNGVANVGNNPTFQNKLLTLEVHILSFNDEIYDERVQINFVKRLRAEIKFDSVSKLTNQIHKDIDTANKILAPRIKNRKVTTTIGTQHGSDIAKDSLTTANTNF